jgi:hypothetical protein
VFLASGGRSKRMAHQEAQAAQREAGCPLEVRHQPPRRRNQDVDGAPKFALPARIAPLHHQRRRLHSLACGAGAISVRHVLNARGAQRIQSRDGRLDNPITRRATGQSSYAMGDCTIQLRGGRLDNPIMQRAIGQSSYATGDWTIQLCGGRLDNPVMRPAIGQPNFAMGDWTIAVIRSMHAMPKPLT